MDFDSNDTFNSRSILDQIQEVIIILNNDLEIKFYNQYSIKILHPQKLTNYIGLHFNEFMKICNKGIRIQNNKLINNILIEDPPHLKQLKINQAVIENNPTWIVSDQIIVEKQDAYNILAKASAAITGQANDLKLTAQNYIDEIKDFFENIIKQMPCYVYWKDKNFRYMYINDLTVQIMGLNSPNEAIGKTDYDFGWEKTLVDSYRATDTKIINSGKEIRNLEEDLIDKNGVIYHTLVNKLPLKASNGEVIGVLGITVDVTNIKEIELQLKAAKIAAEAGERAKDEIIANFSHDMRTPLSGIITTAYELKDDDISEEKRKELAVQLADSGEVLLEMFQKTLEDVAAEHMTEKDIELETFDINLLVDKLIKLEKPSLTQKGLKFISQIDPNIPQFLISDRRKIHHIILNLIGNAIKFTKQGHIELRIELLEKQNDQSQITLKFHVIDTGIGVPEESKKHLFERFFKASASHKAEYKGFGLGLHIAQTYTHLLGGAISFESTEGVGSDFYAVLTLKIANENEIATYNKKLAEKPSLLTINTEMESKPVPKQKPVSSIKTTETQTIPGAPHVLIIEDNLMLRKTTVRLVKKAMLNVTDVDDGLPALELAKTQHFDLILSDVGLLQMSGTEFTQKLRAFEKENNRPPVPIIGVTAHAADGRGECLSAGMNAVTQKPFLKKTLMEILKQFLPNYKSPHS